MFRLQNNVPNVYVDFSRDFQLLCRLYDVVNASVREEVDSMMHLTDTKFIQSNALELLQTKLGFFTNKNFSDKELRYTLSAFPILLKNKGSKLGIKQAINVWANINHFNGKYNVVILNKANNENYYTITIEFLDDINLNYDTTILDEILRYILPTGYTVDYAIITQAKPKGIDELFNGVGSYVDNLRLFSNNFDNILKVVVNCSDDGVGCMINDGKEDLVFIGTKIFTYIASSDKWVDANDIEPSDYGLNIYGTSIDGTKAAITIYRENNSIIPTKSELDESLNIQYSVDTEIIASNYGEEINNNE